MLDSCGEERMRGCCLGQKELDSWDRGMEKLEYTKETKQEDVSDVSPGVLPADPYFDLSAALVSCFEWKFSVTAISHLEKRLKKN